MSAPFCGGGDWGEEKLRNCQGGTANEGCTLGLAVWAEVRVVSKENPTGSLLARASVCVVPGWEAGQAD